MSKKRKGKWALSDADRKIKLEQPVNDAKDKYKEFIGGFFLGGLNFRSKV